jgi:alkylated DNA repair dioxygenase AlkB
MNTLFPIEPVMPEGFTYYPEFITPEEELELLKTIAGIPVHNLIFQGFTAKRKIASFGFDYHFDTRTLTKGKNIPDEFQAVITKVAKHMAVSNDKIAELLLTEYEPGSVINWHRDAPPFDIVAGISLLSDCTFKLRPHDKLKQTRSAIKTLTVKRRSFYVMLGEVRSEWEHSISPLKNKRYSLTFRTLRTPEPR